MESIRVVVRVRPDNDVRPSDNNASLDPQSCVRYDHQSIAIENKTSAKPESNEFHFDKIFSNENSQEDIFEYSKYLVDSSLNGYNATIFAFGMTGSGKTHTISGTNTTSPGIVPRTIQHVFSSLRHKAKDSRSYVSMVFLTYIELYNNTLYDLLTTDQSATASNSLKIHDHPVHGITITGSSSIRTPVTSVEETLALIARGTKHRATATTNLNERSSRSHTIITLEIVRQVIVDEAIIPSSTSSEQLTSVGKINMVDLAGSERVKMSGAEGQALEEAKQINKALTVLGDVLNSLSKYEYDRMKQYSSSINISATSAAAGAMKQPHIPYRNSKLTMLLKDSLGGNSKSMMIATIRQSSSFYQQTMMTLRYASRAKLIQCNPMQNIQAQDSSEAKALRLAVSEVSRLKETLIKRSEEYNDMKARLQELENQKQMMLSSQTSSSAASDRMMMDESLIHSKEVEYHRRLEELQHRANAEQAELHHHMKGIIHQHENILSERENDVVILELRLTEQLRHIESLSRDKVLMIEDKRSVEMTNIELHKVVDRMKVEIKRLRSDNNQLQGELMIAKEMIISSSSTSMLSSSDREALNDALQKLTSSRLKYKSRSEELQASYDEAMHHNDTYKHTISSLQASYDDAMMMMRAKDDEMEMMKKKIDDHHHLMHDAAKMMKKLEKKVMTQREEVKTLRTRHHQHLIDDDTITSHHDTSSSVIIHDHKDDDHMNDVSSIIIHDHHIPSSSSAMMIDDATQTSSMITDDDISSSDASYHHLQSEYDMMKAKCKSLSQEKIIIAKEWKESYEHMTLMMQQQASSHDASYQHLQQQYDDKMMIYRDDIMIQEKKRYDDIIAAHHHDADMMRYDLQQQIHELQMRYDHLYDEMQHHKDMMIHDDDDHVDASCQTMMISSSLTSSSIAVECIVPTCDRASSPVDMIIIDEHHTSSSSYPGRDVDMDIYDYFDIRDEHDTSSSSDIIHHVDPPPPHHHNIDHHYDDDIVPSQHHIQSSSHHHDVSSSHHHDDAHADDDAIGSSSHDHQCTPRKENHHLRSKIHLLQENDKEMLMILERRLYDLNEARVKLLKLNSFYTKPDSAQSTPQSNYKLSLSHAEDRIQLLEHDIRQEKITSSTLQGKLDQQERLAAMQQHTIARLEASLEQERGSRRQEVEAAVKVATRYIADNQLRRSHDMSLHMRESSSSYMISSDMINTDKYHDHDDDMITASNRSGT